MYEYTTRGRSHDARGMRGLGTEPESQVSALQGAILENGCSLPRFGRDSRWGAETETGTRCLAERRGWNFVLQSWPWVAQRMTVPEQGAVAALIPGVPSVGETPAWLPWAAAGFALVAIIMIGSYASAKMERREEEEDF